MRTNVAVAMRALRARRRWRQQDLGARAGLSRDAVCRAESGELDGLTIRSLSRLTDALGATLVIEIRWQGADLDRLIDRAHAHLQAAAQRLASRGWSVHAEVSFNHYGDRGSCDLVAWHNQTQTLLVVEVKSRLGNLQDTLHRLDVKSRLGGILAGQLGCPTPRAVVRHSSWPTTGLPVASSSGTRPCSVSSTCVDGPPARGFGRPRRPSSGFSGSRERQIRIGAAQLPPEGADLRRLQAESRICPPGGPN